MTGLEEAFVLDCLLPCTLHSDVSLHFLLIKILFSGRILIFVVLLLLLPCAQGKKVVEICTNIWRTVNPDRRRMRERERERERERMRARKKLSIVLRLRDLVQLIYNVDWRSALISFPGLTKIISIIIIINMIMKIVIKLKIRAYVALEYLILLIMNNE